MAKKARAVGPFSSSERLLSVDGRTGMGRLMSEVRQSLIDHLGGEPTAPEQLLIYTVTLKVTRLLMQQRHALKDPGDERHWLSWSNSLRRDLETLGLKAKAVGELRLKDVLSGDDQ